MRLTIVTYHYVRDLAYSRYPLIKGLDAAQFREQLEFLAANYTIVRMEDVLSALGGGDGRKWPENAALLTFDDGYIDHYTTVFPLLDKFGIQGSFFPPSMILETGKILDVNKIHFILATGDAGEIYSSLVKEIDYHRGMEFDIPDTQALINEYAAPGRWDTGEVVFIKKMLQTVLPQRMRTEISDKLFNRFIGVDEGIFAKELYCSEEQLMAMKRHGMYIGIHGASHNRLGSMEKDEYEQDISHALDYMDSVGLVGKKAWVMSYPYGSFSDDVTDFIRICGAQAGLIIGSRTPADLQKDSRFELPRMDTNDFPPVSERYSNV